MPDRKRVGLNSARELLEKLDWEIDQYNQFPDSKEQVASYRAFNCAITAWSICDWVWNAASNELRQQFRAASPCPQAGGSEPLAALLRKESRELAICQQIANGAKHFVRATRNDPHISSDRIESVSLFMSKDGQQEHVVSGHAVFITDGDRIYSDLGLFGRTRDYWEQFFERYGIQ
jgi:hypothetical protein